MCQAAKPLKCVVDQYFPTVLNRGQTVLCSCHRKGGLQGPTGWCNWSDSALTLLYMVGFSKRTSFSLGKDYMAKELRPTQIKNAAETVRIVSFFKSTTLKLKMVAILWAGDRAALE